MGRGQAIEGTFAPEQTAVAIEDVVTSGGSLLQAIASMEAAGLGCAMWWCSWTVSRAVGNGWLRLGRHLHAVLTLAGILELLRGIGKIDSATYRRVKAYLEA